MLILQAKEVDFCVEFVQRLLALNRLIIVELPLSEDSGFSQMQYIKQIRTICQNLSSNCLHSNYSEINSKHSLFLYLQVGLLSKER